MNLIFNLFKYCKDNYLEKSLTLSWSIVQKTI